MHSTLCQLLLRMAAICPCPYAAAAYHVFLELLPHTTARHHSGWCLSCALRLLDELFLLHQMQLHHMLQCTTLAATCYYASAACCHCQQQQCERMCLPSFLTSTTLPCPCSPARRHTKPAGPTFSVPVVCKVGITRQRTQAHEQRAQQYTCSALSAYTQYAAAASAACCHATLTTAPLLPNEMLGYV